MAQKKKIKKGDSGAGVDLLDRDKAKNRMKPPSKYQVIYYNDDYTPMDLVTISLYRLDFDSFISRYIILASTFAGENVLGSFSKLIMDSTTVRILCAGFHRSSGNSPPCIILAGGCKIDIQTSPLS